MKAIIVAGGTAPPKKLITRELTSKSVIIAADSGANCLWHYKILPDYLIGDFDSINKKILGSLKRSSTIIERHPCCKDLTDAQLALKKALELRAKAIVFLGCLGGKRVDHLLGALGLLLTCAKLKVDACLKDEHQTITLITKSTIIHGKSGDIFSLQAYGALVKNLSITGSKYELKNHLLKTGDSLTLSNEFCRKKVTIDFTAGRLVLITATID